MYCYRCGALNSAQAAFCEKCGTALQKTDSTANAIVAAPAAAAQYAGFWRRLAASLIDGVVLAIAWFATLFAILFIYFFVTGDEAEEMSEAAEDVLIFIAWAATAVLAWLYYALMESSSRQATLGKMALGIIVTDTQGRRVSFSRATGRFFGRIISSIILYIGYIMIAFTAKKQGLHDMMADCLVVVKNRVHPPL